MGAAPGPSPTTVATQFARVYYRVASKMPARLAEFYGEASELDHGPSLRASGRDAISQLADKLPLLTHRTEIKSVLGQPSVGGNVLVVVCGTYSSPPIPFSQTFVLAKQTDSHDEHFFCRNDVFVRVVPDDSDDPKTEAPVATTATDPPAEPVTPPKACAAVSAESPLLARALPESALRESASVAGLENGVADGTTTHVDHAADPIAGPTAAATQLADTSLATLAATASPPATLQMAGANSPPQMDLHDPASDISPVAASKTVAPPVVEAASALQPMTTASPADAAATAHESGDAVVEDADDRERASNSGGGGASVRKSWASIVSSKEEMQAMSSTGASTGMNSSPSSVPMSATGAGGSPPAVSLDAVGEESGGDTGKERAMSGGGGGVVGVEKTGLHGGHSSFARGGSTLNGRGMHMGRGGPRVFGPSAVVTLASTGMGMTDTRALTNSLREEFGRYGHKLRGVEVKASKGIAFIEYESVEGMRAAVECWAHGPRPDGAFAGVSLHVSEKRIVNMGRRPTMRGTGRGGARGGARRVRPPAATLG